MSTNVEKCRKALSQSKSPLSLYQIIAATKLDGWDSAVALARLVEMGEAVRFTESATLWKRTTVEVQQTETIIGQSNPVGTVIGRA